MKKEIVFPGSLVASEMEFSSGKNAYTSEDGNVYSERVGVIALDDKNRTAQVEPKNRVPRILEEGSIVTGKVSLVKESSVLIEIIDAFDRDNNPLVVHQSFAQLPVRMASGFYVNDLGELFKVGDILKAKVTEVTSYGVTLTTKFPELGVTRAYCTSCRLPMRLFEGKLKCLECGLSDQRKIAADYPLR
ncbi:MAG: exosome complex RNA-binding protein Csl4 [archaeon]